MTGVKKTSEWGGAGPRGDGRVIRCTGLALAALCFVLGLPGQALSADERQEAADPPVLLPPVLVQAQSIGQGGTGTLGLQEQSNGSSRLGVTLRDIPASVEVITQQTMQERGLRSVSEAIQAATGVTVNDLGVNPGAFSMRGFSNQQIRLLFDGLSLGPTGFVTRPRDSWNLDRIEILKGPASVLYGEGAVAGMVNLVTKRPLRGRRAARRSYRTGPSIRYAPEWAAEGRWERTSCTIAWT